ncbi:MAG: ATP-binding protein, partial [Cyclobacteriaceae bacterium]|nr:ATP-binding protein [Cyclobacteriaceae bacterium]
ALLSMSLSQGAFGNGLQALQICLQSIKIADKYNLPYAKGWGLLQLGKIHTLSKNYAKAIDAYRESLATLGPIKDARLDRFYGSPLIRVRMSETFMLMKALDSALYYCRPVYEEEIQDGQLHALPWLMLGQIYLEMGQSDLALEFLHGSRTKIAATGYLFEINFALAKVYQKTNDIDSCIFYANKSLNLAKQTGFYSHLIDASDLLTDIYDHSDPSGALRYSRMAKAYTDSLHDMGRLASIDNLIDFDEQERQYELDAAKTAYREQVQQIWIFSISGGLISAIAIALILYRNNKHKQRANVVLSEQKEEIQSTLEKLESTQSQLIQSEKMASLGELTAGIAHEIQNPLNFVNNFSEVNKELAEELFDAVEINSKDEALKLARSIIENQNKVVHHGKRAEGIVKSMLLHSRASKGEKELTDINALCDEYLRLGYHGFRAKDKSFNAEFKTELDPNLPKITVVPQDIGRVLLNLINNAFQAVRDVEKPEVVVSTTQTRDKIEIRVKDNGPGIPDAIKEKIFQPFFTTKPTGQGTGLGLSLSYDIVKAHGGELKVKTGEGQGSEFIILLPV